MKTTTPLDFASLLGIAFVAGWLSSSGYYQLGHLWQQKNELPKAQALAKCEHIRADANEQIAENAAMGVRPLPGDIAADCPHPKK